MDYDTNQNWVKVKVDRPDEVERVHAALANVMARPGLATPVGNVIVVSFGDKLASEGVKDVRLDVEREFGSPAWITVERALGSPLPATPRPDEQLKRRPWTTSET
jgi:hypothetical protein